MFKLKLSQIDLKNKKAIFTISKSAPPAERFGGQRFGTSSQAPSNNFGAYVFFGLVGECSLPACNSARESFYADIPGRFCRFFGKKFGILTEKIEFIQNYCN